MVHVGRDHNYGDEENDVMNDPEFYECELLTVPPDVAAKAAGEISGCEACSPHAQIPFDWILFETMDREGMYEFIQSSPVRCPLCGGR